MLNKYLFNVLILFIFQTDSGFVQGMRRRLTREDNRKWSQRSAGSTRSDDETSHLAVSVAKFLLKKLFFFSIMFNFCTVYIVYQYKFLWKNYYLFTNKE